MLRRIRFQGLRCFERAELEFAPKLNFIIGPNGAGKTTVLEAVHLIGRGRSFRTRQARVLLKHREPGFVIFGETGQNGLVRRLGVQYSAGRLSLQLDGQQAKGTAELARVLPVHVIEPGLHALIDGSPGERRRFIDWGVFHVEHDYLTRWRAYRRVLGQRNAALKAGASGDVLEVWTEKLIEAGQSVNLSRARYIELIATHVQDFATALLQRRIAIHYRSGWGDGGGFREALEQSRQRDQQTGITQVGPHRADLQVCFDDTAVREQASRGQQKLIATTLILGQVKLFRQQCADAGVLLVDDPAAELDGEALQRLMTCLIGLEAQLIITGLSVEPLAAAAPGRVFHVEQGSIDRVYTVTV